MPLNFLNKFNDDRTKRDSDFNRVKDVIMSINNLKEFGSAKETVNKFLTTYKLGKDSPEHIYFKRILHIKRMKIQGNIEEGLDDESSLKRYIKELVIKNINESLNWSDKDESFGSDDDWSTDPNWEKDQNWDNDPNWVQGSSGPSTSDGDDDPLTEEIDDLTWIDNQNPIKSEEIRNELSNGNYYLDTYDIEQLTNSITSLGLDRLNTMN